MTQEVLANAFALVDKHPILADDPKLRYEVQNGVALLYDEKEQLRILMTEVDLKEMMGP